MNQMHLLRQFGRENANATGPITLSESQRRELAAAVNKGLAALDEFWETAAGRKLTDEEKGLV